MPAGPVTISQPELTAYTDENFTDVFRKDQTGIIKRSLCLGPIPSENVT